MRKRSALLVVFSVLIMGSMLLSACATPTPEQVVVEKTVVVTNEVEKVVTPTAAPEGPVEKRNY